MENAIYELKPYLLMGVGGLNVFNTLPTYGLMSAFLLGVIGGLILGMRLVARHSV